MTDVQLAIKRSVLLKISAEQQTNATPEQILDYAKRLEVISGGWL